MKTLLVALHHSETLTQTLTVTSKMAHKFGAHVIGYYPIPAESFLVVSGPEAVIPFDNTAKRKAEAGLPIVRDAFTARMERDGVSCEFISDHRETMRLSTGIVAHGRLVDLVIVPLPQTKKGEITADIAGEVADIVMATGRPVFVIPPKLSRPFALDHVTVAWNSSREAARATFDSVELLKAARDVEVLWVNPEKTVDLDVDLPGIEIANVLARHDITVQSRPVDSRSSPERTILRHTEENASDLLVIGAYGHSRLRERILGGVTEYVLRHPPCCVLLSN